MEGLKEAVAAGDVSTLKATVLDTGDSLVAPFIPMLAPATAFEANRVVAVPTLGYADGGIYLVHLSSDDMTKTLGTYKITPDKKDYGYYQGQWADLNGDGLLDYITVRFNNREGGSELVWFERPSGSFGLDGKEWTEHVLTEGPYAGLEVDVLDAYPDEVIVWASDTNSNNLGLYRVSTKDGSLVDSRIIDGATHEHSYTVSMVDLNGDGKKELLFCNHGYDADNTGVFALTVPEDIMSGTFEKFTLADDFVPTRQTPGFSYAVRPDGQTSGRAHILVAGDDDGAAYLLTPTGDASKFEYK